ncbi:MAG TPA: hypothetical protein VGG85_12765 [Terracidiphilus sp.]|jgi:hypothetical protein
MAAPVPPVPGISFLLDSYAGKVRALSIVWFIWAGLSLLFGFMGMAFARAFMFGHNNWFNQPGPGPWLGPAIIHFAWIFIVVRAGLALAAGWGLMERTQWGRIMAIVAAVFSLLKFPFGTALGIWTLVTLLGYRNQSLYEQLPQL